MLLYSKYGTIHTVNDLGNILIVYAYNKKFAATNSIELKCKIETYEKGVRYGA